MLRTIIFRSSKPNQCIQQSTAQHNSYLSLCLQLQMQYTTLLDLLWSIDHCLTERIELRHQIGHVLDSGLGNTDHAVTHFFLHNRQYLFFPIEVADSSIRRPLELWYIRCFWQAHFKYRDFPAREFPENICMNGRHAVSYGQPTVEENRHVVTYR